MKNGRTVFVRELTACLNAMYLPKQILQINTSTQNCLLCPLDCSSNGEKLGQVHSYELMRGRGGNKNKKPTEKTPMKPTYFTFQEEKH